MAWLIKSGVAQVESWQQVYDLGVIEVQLRETPAVLADLSQVDGTLSISRITSEGIVFYLTDVPLWIGVAEGNVPRRKEALPQRRQLQHRRPAGDQVQGSAKQLRELPDETALLTRADSAFHEIDRGVHRQARFRT